MRIAIRIFPATWILLLLVSCGGKEKKDTEQSGLPPDSSNYKPVQASVNPYAAVDVSPMDMSYYPVDYPILKMTKKTDALPLARVIYSRPHLQGRRLFHEVLKYGEPWRLGANESTELQLYKDARIQDKPVKAGRYVVYCIPQPDHWTFVLNSNIDSWGLQPDSTKDVLRVSLPVKQTGIHLEYYTMVFEKKDAGAELVMAWDDIEARVSITF